MIDAEINGKVPEVNHLEDVLTSCYFGSIKHCSITTFYDYFISSLRDNNDQSLFLESIPPTFNFKIIFWPRLEDRSEPDIMIAITDELSKVKYLFLVEVKYYSQQNTYDSSEEFESHIYENQLSREYINLCNLKIIDNLTLDGNTKRFLVYLTADYSLPAADINKAFEELTDQYTSTLVNDFCWVSWYQLYNKLEQNHNSAQLHPIETSILKDLGRYLKKKGFWSFNGFGPFDFDLDEMRFKFIVSKKRFDWNFEDIEQLNFSYEA